MERVSSDDIKLYEVSDESGSMKTEEVVPSNGAGLTADLLDVRRRRCICVSCVNEKRRVPCV